MRKDLFIVGARLLGIWILIGVINPISHIVAPIFIKTQPPTYVQLTNVVNGILHFIIGYFLLFKTNSLYKFLDRILTETEINNDENSAA